MDFNSIIDRWFETHDEISKKDYKFLQELIQESDTEFNTAKEAAKEEMRQLQLENPIAALPKGARMTVKAQVMNLLEKSDEGYTANEIFSRVEGAKDVNTIHTTLSLLKKDKIIDSSTTSPKIYFLRSKPNPIVAEALKNTTKVSHLG
jgi:predicted Zn-ribbon and HTH transcriptional regulator